MKALGVTTVWISPHQLNVNGAYHGYHARDFQAYAPQFGGQVAFDRMRADLKRAGIRLILDVVPNHGGDLINNNNAYRPPPNTYNLSWRNGAIRHAPPFDSLDVFHAHGNINNFSGQEQILGELVGLDDFKTERADVRTTLTQIFKDWITRTDADGFRIDTVKHVDMDFWQYWSPEIRAHAASLGKANFFQFGEVWDGNSAFVGSYTGTQAGGPFALDSVIDYPMYYRTNDVFARQTAGARSIMDYYGWQSFDYDPAALGRLVTNLDNHDNVRFLHGSLANGNRGRLRAALAFQLLSPGVPSVYYGTEQWFDGGNDPGCREDMFDGQFEQGPSSGDNFNMAGDGFLWMRSLNELRRKLAPLRRGSIVERQAQSSAGAFAFSRILAGHPEVLVAINTSDAATTGGVWNTTHAPGTLLLDVLDPMGTTMTVQAGGSVTGVGLAGNGVRVLVPIAFTPNWDPTVVSASVAHGQKPGSLIMPLRLTLSEPIDPSTLMSAVVTTPTQAGLSVQWDPGLSQVVLTPGVSGWTPDGNGYLRIGLGEAVTDLTSQPLYGGYELLWDFVRGLAEPLPLTDPLVDGRLGDDPRYVTGELAVQTVQTQFGDNTDPTPQGNSGGSELANLWMHETTGTLYVGVGGNLENNGNCIALLVDLDGTSATGTSNLNGTGAVTDWLAGGVQGTVLPAGFGCDLAVVSAAGSGGSVSLWAYRWEAGGSLIEERFLGTVDGTPGAATRGVLEGVVAGQVIQVSVGLDNSHVGPVNAGTGTAVPTGAGAQTGLELALPRSLLGGTAGRSFLVGLSGSTGFWSNQFLPPVSPGSNLGWQPQLPSRGAVALQLPAIPVVLSGFGAD
jgi:glycosidase